jgi:hypothetical protein
MVDWVVVDGRGHFFKKNLIKLEYFYQMKKRKKGKFIIIICMRFTIDINNMKRWIVDVNHFSLTQT